jgi:hypothetical protein
MRYPLIIVIVAMLFTACHKDVMVPVHSRTANTKDSGDVATISENEAKNHVGEDVVVSGTVSGFFASSQTTNVYLYFDSDIFHPKFAVVWPGTNDPPIKELQSLILNAENISVSGEIILETNVPEIIVSSWSQITIN